MTLLLPLWGAVVEKWKVSTTSLRGAARARTGRPLSELAARVPLYPQEQRAIRVRQVFGKGGQKTFLIGDMPQRILLKLRSEPFEGRPELRS